MADKDILNDPKLLATPATYGALKEIGERLVDGVVANSRQIRAENDRLRKRVDLLAARSVGDDILEARIKRLEGAAAVDELPEGRAQLFLCTRSWCVAAGIVGDAQYKIFGNDEAGLPVAISCPTPADVALAVRSYWPFSLTLLANNLHVGKDGDPGLLALKKA